MEYVRNCGENANEPFKKVPKPEHASTKQKHH